MTSNITSAILQSFNKETRYGAQKIYDSFTKGTGLLVYRWLDWEQGHDIHIESKDDNPLYKYLIEDPTRITSIGFMPGDVTERFNEQVGLHADDDKAFLKIDEYKSVVKIEAEILYRNVKGHRMNNFELISLSDRRKT